MSRNRWILPAVVISLAWGCSSADLVDPRLEAAHSCVWHDAQRSFDLPWHELSDEQLYQEVATACGRVFIGFKEAGSERGVDDKGVVLTTPETVAQMTSLLHDLNVIIEHAYNLPVVAGWMPVSLELVRTLRYHPSVDYLEPIFPGTRW
jgi:hypothetical protein